MSVLKCKMCGGDLVIDESGVAVCEYCGTKQTVTSGESDAPAPIIIKRDESNVKAENERKTAEANARAQEARLQSEQQRVKAEQSRLEQARIAEKNRIEKTKKAKETRRKLLRAFLIILLVGALGILTVTFIIPSVKYSGAVKDIEAENYEEAYLTFKELRTFKNSQDMAKSLVKDHPEVARVGDFIFFGTYDQDNNPANGKEEIEWKVLSKDENGKMLVISRYALDCREYHSSLTPVTWETSEIRTWLNNDFLNSAFDKVQGKSIIKTTLENTPNNDYKTDGGNSTKDKIFLLSIDEVKRYMPNATLDRICFATKYAEAQGSDLDGLTRGCRWWLRTPGATKTQASFVKIDGFIMQIGAPVNYEKRSVRPAMWVEF